MHKQCILQDYRLQGRYLNFLNIDLFVSSHNKNILSKGEMCMSLDYEKKKYKILKEMVDHYRAELLKDREYALDMPIETENGFNIEREVMIDDIDEKLEILKRHASEPYFAKLIFQDNDDGEKFNGYIGRLSIGEINSPDDQKIVDWRAPISDLYYNGRLGNTSYEANGNQYSVNLQLKRQIDIKDNEVKSIYDFEESISSDEFLKPYLTQSADNRLKNIVATIQEEQNKIIRLPIFKNCIIQGVAGSGKTTVALHRLSYLMYNFKKSIRPEEFLIISPNDIFMSYISNILVDLDADKSNSFSFNTLIKSIIGSEYKILNKQEQYNKLNKQKISPNYLSVKNTVEFAKIIDTYVQDVVKQQFAKPLKIKNIEVLNKETISQYFTLQQDIPITNAIQHCYQKLGLAIQYDDKLKKQIANNLDNSNCDLMTKFNIIRKTESGNYGYIKSAFKTNFNIIKLYQDFISSLDKYINYEEVKILQKQTLDNIKKKTLAYDDLATIVYLYAKFYEFPYYNKLKCIFIDEAQDISELMFLALRKIFKNASFSIFGDIAQGIYSYQAINNWDSVSNIIGDVELLYLNRSYRTSIEIMEEANTVLTKLGFPPANNVVRHGEPVEHHNSKSNNHVKEQLNILNDKYSHTAIICKSDEELEIAQKELSDLNLIVLDENNLSYGEYKNCILTVQTAKGLEFDSIIIYDRSSYSDNNNNDLKLLYVAETRALHKLIINGCQNN